MAGIAADTEVGQALKCPSDLLIECKRPRLKAIHIDILQRTDCDVLVWQKEAS